MAWGGRKDSREPLFMRLAQRGKPMAQTEKMDEVRESAKGGRGFTTSNVTEKLLRRENEEPTTYKGHG